MVGCAVIFVWSIWTNLLHLNDELGVALSIWFALLMYSVSVAVVFVLAFVIASPIYHFLMKLGVSGYLSSSLLGIGFVLSIFGMQFSADQIFWLTAGISTGSFYHYVYTNHPMS